MENAADFWFVVLTLDTYPLVDHERAVFLRSDCGSLAIGLQSFCSLFAVLSKIPDFADIAWKPM